MGLYVWKFPFRKALAPLARLLKDVNPDVVSYIAVVVALCTGLCFYFSGSNPALLLIIIALTFLRMTLNTLDGVMALNKGTPKITGEIVNALPDRYSDVFVMLGIAFSAYCNVYLGAIAAVSVLLVSYTGMLGKAIGMNWQHHGPLGKVERLLLIMVACFAQYIIMLPQAEKIRSFLHVSAIEILMIWFAIAAQITVLNRLKGMLGEIKGKENA